MISVSHFTSRDPDFASRAQPTLIALAARPGYLGGSLSRCIDEPTAWVLVTEWENVGSYRRALGNAEVRVHATQLLGQALDVPAAFETLIEVGAGGETATVRASDLAASGSEPAPSSE